MIPKALNSALWLNVNQMMHKQVKVLHLNDSLKTVVQFYQDCRLDTLPVVDNDENLIGVFPKKRLYKALLEGVSLDSPCTSYIVYNPIFVSSELTYDEMSLVNRVSRSRVDHVVVVDKSDKVVGMIGTGEYLKESLDVIMTSYALLESIFRTDSEGIIVIDNNTYILRINPAAEKMFGLNYSNIRGKHLKEVLPDLVISDKPHLIIKQTIQSIPVIVSQIPIIENNLRIGTSITFVDMSDAVKIAQELETVKQLQTTLSGVLKASFDGVFVSDSNGKIKFANEMASQLVGRSSDKIVGMQITELLGNNCPALTAQNGVADVYECTINGKRCIISHFPIKNEDNNNLTMGMVSTVYLDNNVLADTLARKWFSLQQQVQYYSNELEKYSGESKGFDKIITKNNNLIKIKKDGKRIARSCSTVLITGESGVGKDVFARAIHAASPRASHPFIKVNCAAIPESLLESELFGYAPGSFTGASKKGKPGYFEQADEGTIFLDEIGDMPLSVQVKVLQVLQEKQFMRVGGTDTKTVDVRIIAATNRDLLESIRNNTFREDLYYRLNVIEFHLPSLRERPEDVIPLAESFIIKYNNILGTNITGITQTAKNALARYNWPGNIRELENAIERAANYVWDGVIGTEHLPAHIFQSKKEDPAELSSYRVILSDIDKELVINAIKESKGNKSAAARLLNLSRSAFYKKLSKYNLM